MLNMVLLFIGTTEILVIGGIALLIFGGKKLPELMRGLGKGVKEFKEGMHDVKEEVTNPSEQPQDEVTRENVEQSESPSQVVDKPQG